MKGKKTINANFVLVFGNEVVHKLETFFNIKNEAAKSEFVSFQKVSKREAIEQNKLREYTCYSN